VQILDALSLPGRSVTRFGSEGFTAGTIAHGDSLHIGVLRLDAGGRIGRHPTVQRQILVLLEGDATVSGVLGQPAVELAPGQAAAWEPGESHETRSRTGMKALVIEGDFERI
jgi:quercetin dioxygenase-like cupin family protein